MAEQSIPFQAEHPTKQLKIERRAWVRMPSDQDVYCQPMPALTAAESDAGWLGKVRDVAPGGIALILTRPFEVGTVLIVELRTEAREVRRVVVRVVHATPKKNRRWIVGCAFASTLSQEELQTFLSE